MHGSKLLNFHWYEGSGAIAPSIYQEISSEKKTSVFQCVARES